MEKIRFLSRKEAATYLIETWGIRRTAKTLAKLATMGGGPPYRKDKIKTLYDPADLDIWARETLSPRVASTAEFEALKQVGSAS